MCRHENPRIFCPVLFIAKRYKQVKEILLLIFLVIGLTSCKSQEIDGVWMSYKNYVIDKDSGYTARDEGVLIDFDNQTIGIVDHDSIIPIRIDLNQSKLFMKSDTLNVSFKVFGKDSIEIDLGRNMMHVFRPLNLKRQLAVDKKNIITFLTQNKFNELNDSITLKFRKDLHYFSTMSNKKNEKRFLESRLDSNGYWFLKELKGNFFLIFAIEEVGDQNIYQITKLTDCKMELLPLQEYGFLIKNLTELKTCL